MARVVFDARPVTPQMHGISRYAYRLLAELSRSGKYELLALRSGPFLETAVPEVPSVECDIRLYSPAELVRLPRLLGRLGCDLYFTPTYTAPLAGPPVMMTVHDLTHLLRSCTGWRYRAYYDWVVGPAARRARCVMTETQFTAERLVRRLGVRRSRIAVIPSGAGLDAPPPDVPRTAAEVFCVVNPKPHKNAAGALAMARVLRRSRPDATLVLVGKLPPELAPVAERQEGVEWHPFVAEEELARRMASAAVFLFPSFSEGFGYPPLEAMASGTPVVASNASCIPEVLGDAALYADPSRPDEMAAAVARVLGDDALRADLVRRGRERLGLYRWEEMGRRVASAIDGVLAAL